MEDFNYYIYIRLLKVFESSLQIYELSKNTYLFKEKLIKNNIILSDCLFNYLTNGKIKNQAHEIFKFFSFNQIKVIPIHSLNYPNELYHMDMPPLLLLVHGNIQEIHKPMVYIYHTNKFSNYAKKIYQIMARHITLKDRNLIDLSYDNSDSKVVIKVFDNFDLKSMSHYINELSIEKTTVFLFHHSKLYEYYFISCLSKIVIIPEASYEQSNYLKIIVDSMMEQGKDILVVPGNIYHKNTYFSNYLIKEGANVLLNKYDIDHYL